MLSKNVLLLFIGVLVNTMVLAQPDALRGPQNTLPDGVIDGVVVEDEVPVRSRVEYEYVRLADYAQSWRVFSRIDAREKVNTKLFYPYDYFNDYKFPKTRQEISNNAWVKNQERWSLWTIIATHVILGDLTVFKVSSEENPLVEDGYQLKYPVVQKTKDDFFTNSKYRSEITKCLSYGEAAKPYIIQLKSSGSDWPVVRSNSSYERWLDSLVHPAPGGDIYITDDGLSDYNDIIGYHENDSAAFKAAWIAAKEEGGIMKAEPEVSNINSQSITAYNIKEDWFFDKERSMLDKRIICIAPVGRFVYDPNENDKKSADYTEIDRFSSFLGVNNVGQLVDAAGTESTDEFVELELFWLYFPQLRHVLVNYYVYNDQNDAYRMSYDDLFWKRMFSARMYKKTDQYDRSVEDYRYGVDALYEAEKFKETMRTWETDLWNY
jgi:hypothetical protein